MSLVDTTDGILMLGAYGWAYIKPIRKLYYNLNITLVSVLIAFVIGGIEVLSIIGDRVRPDRRASGTPWADLDFGLDRARRSSRSSSCSWAISTLIYRWKGYDDLPVVARPVRGPDPTR